MHIPNYAAYIAQLAAICLKRNLPMRCIGTVTTGDYFRKSYPLYRVTIQRPAAGLCAMGIVAGVHAGTEPAAAYGVLDFLKRRYTPSQASATGAECFVYPVMNPFGFDQACRFNAFNQDINRTFGTQDTPSQEAQLLLTSLKEKPIQFLYSMHEDDSATGAYIYFSDLRQRMYAERMLEHASLVHHVPINSNREDANGVQITRGLAPYLCPPYPTKTTECPLEDRLMQESISHFCVETPSQCDLGTRTRLQADWLRFAWSFI